MIKINTRKEIKNIDGSPAKDFTVGKAIANILAGSKTQGKAKLYVLMTKFYDEKEVEVDAADLNLLKQEIEKNEVYPGALIAGQLIIMLDDLKEESSKKK